MHTFADIYKLRPPPATVLGEHVPKSYKPMNFEMIDQSAQCGTSETSAATVKPTCLLGDKISISEFLHSFQNGYEALESFQERTYLYAKPFIFERSPRLGLVFQGEREEPGLPLPLYFQWSTGEAYRFQSESGLCRHSADQPPPKALV